MSLKLVADNLVYWTAFKPDNDQDMELYEDSKQGVIDWLCEYGVPYNTYEICKVSYCRDTGNETKLTKPQEFELQGWQCVGGQTIWE